MVVQVTKNEKPSKEDEVIVEVDGESTTSDSKLAKHGVCAEDPKGQK